MNRGAACFSISKIRIFSVITCICLAFPSCDDTEDEIPYVPVSKTIYLSEYPQLNIIGGLISIGNEGVNGIILYRESDNSFRAYERTCTHEPQGSCAVSPVNDTQIARCPCCDSEFYLSLQGDVKKGPATRSLLQYETSFDGEKVRIFN